MRILHTSDWHIGHVLYGRKRYEEFEAFLDWTLRIIRDEQVDVLLVAGDIFDTATPSHRSQELYYRFLCALSNSPCRHAVLIGGNHDSPTFLNAPRDLLRALSVHVVGEAAENLEDEVLLLRDAKEKPELIVCATPYLRDRDLRTAEAGESMEDKEKKLVDGICAHYKAVSEKAEALREMLRAKMDRTFPVVAMGHLFASGGAVHDGDGVKDLYIGSLARVPLDAFPDCVDYTALGHLHGAQIVGGRQTCRYSGSPLAMSFKEAQKTKIVCIVDIDERGVAVRPLEVPVFQRLHAVKGTVDEITNALRHLAKSEVDKGAWIDVTYEGDEIVPDLKDRIVELASDLDLTIVNIKNGRIIERAMEQAEEGESLCELSEEEVFERCLDAHKIPDEQRAGLRHTYVETLKRIREEDGAGI